MVLYNVLSLSNVRNTVWGKSKHWLNWFAKIYPEMSTMIWRYLKPKLRCGGQIMRRWWEMDKQPLSGTMFANLLKSMCGNPGNQHVKTRACRKRWWTLETVLDAKLSHFLKSNYAKLFIPKVELSWIIMNYAELIHKIHIIIPCFFISTLNSLNTPRPHWAFQLGKSGSCCFSVMGGAKLANSAAFGEAWHCGIKYTNMHPASCTYPINKYIYI